MDKNKGKIEYSKVLDGYVVQQFNEHGECVDQEFLESSCIYRDSDDEEFTPDYIDEFCEEPFPALMVQPGLDYYVMFVAGCVEPILYGPYTEEESKSVHAKMLDDGLEGNNTFFVFCVTKGAEIKGIDRGDLNGI